MVNSTMDHAAAEPLATGASNYCADCAGGPEHSDAEGESDEEGRHRRASVDVDPYEEEVGGHLPD